MENICRSSSDKVVLEIYDQNNHQSSLQTLDISTGEIENSIPLEMGTVAITSGVEQDLLIMDTQGVYGYNLQDQSKNWYIKWKGPY